MPSTTLKEADIPKVLTGLGWIPKAVGERTWRCTIASPTAGIIKLVVRHAGAWMYLSVLPFFDPDSIKPWGAGKFPLGFLGRLLAVNRNLILVKFALDDDGDVVLRTELPTESLQKAELETAATTLVRTTEQYRGPVRDALLEAAKIAANPVTDD
ncbi:MAG: YbjN domain-containing protein [Deltaproteobacteria bacterium]